MIEEKSITPKPEPTIDQSEVKKSTDQSPEPTLESKPQSKGAVNFYKQQLEEMKLQNSQLKSKMDAFTTDELQKQQRYKELWEGEKKTRVIIEEKSQKNYSTFMETLKGNAIEKEAIKAGLKKEALQDLDLVDKSMLEIESTSTGKINILGVNDFMDNLKLNRPHWFGNNQPLKYNSAVPNGAEPKPISDLDLLGLQKSNFGEYNRLMRERLNRKS